MRVWIEIGDLLAYGRLGLRPTGIQRLTMELAQALRELDPERVRFARLDVAAGGLSPLTHGAAQRLFDQLSAPEAARPRIHRFIEPREPSSLVSPRPGVVRRTWRRLPGTLRGPLREGLHAQGVALRHFARAIGALPRILTATSRAERVSVAPEPEAGRESPVPGDVLLTLGAAWGEPRYPDAVVALRRRHGLRHALLVYDLIPAFLPECFEARLVRDFLAFMRATLPEAEALFAISRATAGDVERWAREEGFGLRAKPDIIPLGAGLRSEEAVAPLPEGLEQGGYALFVSTLEPRKNHGLAFRAWRRLLAEMPRDEVPSLVFAGRQGWLASDLVRQFQGSRFLDGKLILIEGADDALLAALYRGAQFTLFPSLYEGWGLPVSESLGFGKVCIASRAPAVVEAGGDFCLYHDADCVSEAVALYRWAITQPGAIARMEQRILREWRAPSWSDAAKIVLAGCDAAAALLVEPAAEARP